MIEVLLACVMCIGQPGVAAAQGVRVVDSVTVGLAADEAVHHLSGERTTGGSTGGRTWRSAAGWFAYTLRTYDDSPLTIVCSLADAGDIEEAFEVLVDGRVVKTVRRGPAAMAETLSVAVPFAQTSGKTTVTITFRALAGTRTARLLEVKSVQEHLE